ncbi:MAG: hypothetical protein KF713_06160 [Turneriella sp.]|nr:hypothetical protein [Turneriella sp.]
MYNPPGGKGFWARRSDLNSGDSSFYRVTSMFAASSKNAEIYTEAKRDVPKSAIDGLLAAFESNVVPVEHLWYTTPTDVDGSGKIILLLLDIQDGYQAGGGYIAGYFDPINHYTEAAVNSTNSKYHSNHAEMLYLDTYPGLEDALRKNNLTQFYATLAHEYQHLLQFGKYYRGDQNDVEPPWVDEGLAEVSSDLTGYGPQTGRANNFRSALLNGTSLIKETNSFMLDNYATAYVYFRYLADVYGLGGIASIFKNNQIGVAGVNAGIEAVDSGLVGGGLCNETSGLTYKHFSCSYRYMWAAMLSGNLGDQPTVAKIHFNSNASSFTLGGAGNYTYALKPATTAYSQELTNTLAAGSYAASSSQISGALQSYAVKLMKINGTYTDTNFTSGGTGLTIVAGPQYFAVFNHDVSTSVTHGAAISDQLTTLTGEVTPASLQTITADAPGGASAPLDQQKLHWHFPLQPEMREFLQSEEPR